MGSTREQAGAVLWVIVIIAVIPWRYVFAQLHDGQSADLRGRRE